MIRESITFFIFFGTMENLNQIEKVETMKSKENISYNPEAIQAQIAKIREREVKEEPRKKNPEILDRWLKRELAKIPDSE